MRSIFAVLLASLAVLCALFVLVSEDRGTPSGGSGLMQRGKTSDAGDRLMQALMLRRQRQSDYPKFPNTDQVIKAQQVLKNDGIYSRPNLGTIPPRPPADIRPLHQPNQLTM